MTGNALYQRMIEQDYGDQERADLMRSVWEGTPFIADVRTESPDTDLFREIREWCSEKWGREAWPIHGKPGRWQSGSVTLYGWTWFGFETQAMLDEFAARFEIRPENTAPPPHSGHVQAVGKGKED